MNKQILICPICNDKYEKSNSHYNRAIKLNAKMYCSKICSSEARRLHKSKDLIKSEKAEYDKKRLNGDKRQEILNKRKEYHHENRDIINHKQKIRNKARMPQHVIYCRQPSQREKERIRNRKKNGLTEIKKCLICNQEKQKIHFECYNIFPDKRLYMCMECEKNQEDELGISNRHNIQCIRSALIKTKSNLTIRDIAKYPYLIEANKYLLLLKRQIK